jgi:hypothetical protein
MQVRLWLSEGAHSPLSITYISYLQIFKFIKSAYLPYICGKERH